MFARFQVFKAVLCDSVLYGDLMPFAIYLKDYISLAGFRNFQLDVLVLPCPELVWRCDFWSCQNHCVHTVETVVIAVISYGHVIYPRSQWIHSDFSIAIVHSWWLEELSIHINDQLPICVFWKIQRDYWWTLIFSKPWNFEIIVDCEIIGLV